MANALSSYSAAIVTPIYYVFFTTATMMSTAFLFQGFPVGSTVNGVSILFGFLTIVGGVALLFQYSLKLQEIAKQAGNTVARMATAGPTSSVAEPSVIDGTPRGENNMLGVRHPMGDNRSESEFDGTSMVGLDEVGKYESVPRNQGSATVFGKLSNAAAGDVIINGSTVTVAEPIGRSSLGGVPQHQQQHHHYHQKGLVIESPTIISNRPSLVIDGDGVDERDEVTSISHALVPGLKLIKMMPSLLSGGTRLETLPAHQPPRSFSLGTAAHPHHPPGVESDSKSVLSWIRRKSTHSADSGSEAEFGPHQRSKMPKHSHSLFEFPNRGVGETSTIITERSAPLPRPNGSVMTVEGQRKGSKGSHHISFAPSQDVVQEEGSALNEELQLPELPLDSLPPSSPEWLASKSPDNSTVIPDGLCSSPSDEGLELGPIEKPQA
ncbi:UNVERIFIED_CONTAM: hypothetical protein HDU68_011493 [Siphonaria sp. JEL0065]|nr:hypothetical protein HDU68_011493 [Siphonaria sp. JEL0065]